MRMNRPGNRRSADSNALLDQSDKSSLPRPYQRPNGRNNRREATPARIATGPHVARRDSSHHPDPHPINACGYGPSGVVGVIVVILVPMGRIQRPKALGVPSETFNNPLMLTPNPLESCAAPSLSTVDTPRGTCARHPR